MDEEEITFVVLAYYWVERENIENEGVTSMDPEEITKKNTMNS